jgi:hypothetical protein
VPLVNSGALAGVVCGLVTPPTTRLFISGANPSRWTRTGRWRSAR